MYRPQPGPQLAAHQATMVYELFFGGARGGGKSFYLCGDYLQGALKYKQHWHGILLRKSLREFDQLRQHAAQVFEGTGAKYKKTDKVWEFPWGSTLRYGFVDRDSDVEQYQGQEYAWIGWDELTNWATDYAYSAMMGSLRYSKIMIPDKRIRATGNPGGLGHSWVKRRFVSPHPQGSVIFKDKRTARTRMFIRSLPTDNKILMMNDPEYLKNLEGIPSETLRKAWLFGDWDVVAGQFFSEWDPEVHVIEPFEPPNSWFKFVAMDWGMGAPFSVHWFAIPPVGQADYDLLIYREWYGSHPDNLSKGLRFSPEDVASGIKARSQGESIKYFVADPQIWDDHTGNGRSVGDLFAASGIFWTRANSKREPGCQYYRRNLKEQRLKITSNNEVLIETIPLAQEHPTKPEEYEKFASDHALDSSRFGQVSFYHAPEYQTPMLIDPMIAFREQCEKGTTIKDIFPDDF